MSGSFIAGAALHAGAHVHYLGADQGQGLGDGFGGKSTGQHHCMAAQPLSSLRGNCQVERDPGPTQGSGDARLDQHCVRIGNGGGHEIQIGRRRDSHDAPNLESFAAEPVCVCPGIGAMELGAAKPCGRTDLEDFLDRLFTKDTENRHAVRCGNQLAGLTDG